MSITSDPPAEVFLVRHHTLEDQNVLFTSVNAATAYARRQAAVLHEPLFIVRLPCGQCIDGVDVADDYVIRHPEARVAAVTATGHLADLGFVPSPVSDD